MDVIQTVRDAVIGVLKSNYPDTDVYAEEIPQTVQDNKDSEWFFVDVSVTALINLPPLQLDLSMLISVDYHNPAETNRIYTTEGAKLMEAFIPTIDFLYREEQRQITVHNPGFNISGHLLHLTLPIQFVIDKDGPQYDLMDDLDISMKGRE